ncbi:MAG: oligosaccharide flippase family protein [Parcubacteria group bacterium]|nr:oligosaccharide flippase family protein [Parcubacteria group bacterium]
MNVFIDKLQKFFGVDLRYIARGGFWLGLDQFFSIALSLALTVAFANLLSQELYGIYRYILSVFAILTIFTLPNMDVAAAASVAGGMEGSLTAALKTRIRWGLAGAAGALAMSGYYFFNQNSLLGFSFLIVAAFLPFNDSFGLYGALLKGRRLFKLKSQYSIVTRIVSAASLIGALFLSQNLFWILVAFFAPYVFLRLFFFWFIMKKEKPNEKTDPHLITYGKHLSVMQFLGSLVNYLDSLLVFHYLGAAPLAVYSIAMAPITKFQQTFSIIPELALPKFSAKNAEETKTHLLKKIFKTLIFVGAGVGIYILIAPTVFKLFFPKYTEAVFYSQLISLILLALPFGLIYTFFQSKAMKEKIYHYNIAIRIFQLAIVAALVPFFGIMGAIAARVFFQIFSVFILLILFRRT